ncbi:hypothetical protein HPB50_013001 [Hyalomma asiaticum]|uniref:Uncharacterized protein n=1 Tax=Hyalomma asiaticum TaxID=266040 RepID=A0ACB7S8T0_HYAAI|nr:hypothetical protein HPB50_013001 [Hyalomma asiaticum]
MTLSPLQKPALSAPVLPRLLSPLGDDGGDDCRQRRAAAPIDDAPRAFPEATPSTHFARLITERGSPLHAGCVTWEAGDQWRPAFRASAPPIDARARLPSGCARAAARVCVRLATRCWPLGDVRALSSRVVVDGFVRERV